MIKASDTTSSGPHSKTLASPKPILTESEIISNSFIFLLAGHETSANSIHFSILELAISLPVQRHLQFDIDKIIGPDKPVSEISYYADMPRLYNSMVGAVLNEQLRLMPAVINIPKAAAGDQTVFIDGKQYVVPDKTFVHLNAVGTGRNPRYYPYSPSKISGKTTDLDDFVPERWLPRTGDPQAGKNKPEEQAETEAADGLEKASFETSTSASLFTPPKGSFLAFSDGPRACPGRRFAQVEITAVLTAVFRKYSVELDVADWASDEEVANMGKEQKRVLYEKAIDRARGVIRACQPIITLQMKPGQKVPVRFVERGRERFSGVF